MIVTLTESEWLQAQLLGALRQSRAEQRGSKDRHGLIRDDHHGLLLHVLGAAGELAVAQVTNTYPTYSEGVGATQDLGRRIAVRTRSRPYYELIVRRDDADDRVYVLARTTMPFVAVTDTPPEIEVVGAIIGSAAKSPAYQRDWGNRRPAYFVPDAVLAPMCFWSWHLL